MQDYKLKFGKKHNFLPSYLACRVFVTGKRVAVFSGYSGGVYITHWGKCESFGTNKVCKVHFQNSDEKHNLTSEVRLSVWWVVRGGDGESVLTL